jgi:hypothetical protein
MERGLRERIDGWVSPYKLYHGNKKISSRLGVEKTRRVKVSVKANDNFLSLSQPKERFLKKRLFLQAR